MSFWSHCSQLVPFPLNELHLIGMILMISIISSYQLICWKRYRIGLRRVITGAGRMYRNGQLFAGWVRSGRECGCRWRVGRALFRSPGGFDWNRPGSPSSRSGRHTNRSPWKIRYWSNRLRMTQFQLIQQLFITCYVSWFTSDDSNGLDSVDLDLIVSYLMGIHLRWSILF